MSHYVLIKENHLACAQPVIIQGPFKHKSFQYRSDILGETDLLHSHQAKRILSQGKGDRFKCSPIPCTCVVKYITAARELSTCVRINQP